MIAWTYSWRPGQGKDRCFGQEDEWIEEEEQKDAYLGVEVQRIKVLARLVSLVSIVLFGFGLEGLLFRIKLLKNIK